MKHLQALMLLGASIFATGGQAIEYSDQAPLADTLSATVKSCRTGTDSLSVPMRTSGVDIIPLFANGYQTESSADSIFSDNDITVSLFLENDITEQVKKYLSCESPIMRGTQGMLNAVADLTENDPRTKQVAIYQHGYSNGADAIVARGGLSSAADLSGATIVTQAYGPHLAYLSRILADGQSAVERNGGTWESPTIRYTSSLMGFQGDTPGAAFLDDPENDAVLVTSADAQTLTSGGNTGTGAEGSVKGATIMLSTRSANRIISEVYVVRADYLEKNREQVRNFVRAMFSAEEVFREDVVKQVVDWNAAGELLLGDPGADSEAKDLWRNVETVGVDGNDRWSQADGSRSWKTMNNRIQSVMVASGLLASAYDLTVADWDYSVVSGDVFDKRRAELPSFDSNATASAVKNMKESGELEENSLMEFEIHFQPNQRTFSQAEYRDEFDRVAELAETYGGAVITVEGHSDPMNYLRKKHNGESNHQLRSIRQAAKNLSMNRAIEVRDSVIEFAEDNRRTMDESQFVTLGHGITEPKTGLCEGDPCPPQTEAEWKSNMRVTFKLVNVEAEASTFTPVNSW